MRIHEPLRVTLAMQAKLTDRLSGMVGVIAASDAQAERPKAYRKKVAA